MNATYQSDVSHRALIEASVQQNVKYTVPANSYALVLTMKDQISAEAVLEFVKRYTSVENAFVVVRNGRNKRSSALIGVGTSLISAVKGADTGRADDPYLRTVMRFFSTGLRVFSVGMGAVSLVPNPLTLPLAIGTGAISLGLSVAEDVIYKN